MTQTEALLAIAKRNGGTITPAAVIEEARNKKSVYMERSRGMTR